RALSASGAALVSIWRAPAGITVRPGAPAGAGIPGRNQPTTETGATAAIPSTNACETTSPPLVRPTGTTVVRKRASSGPTISRLRLAYIVSRYPLVSHTFIAREVRELRRLGAHV